MNNGKRFEDDFNKSSIEQGVCNQRLYDTMGGYQGVKYPCDFITYQRPNEFYLELKSTTTGTVPLVNLSKTQYEGLLAKEKYDGVVAGLLLKYSKYGTHYFITISEVTKLKHSGKKSIMHKDILKGKIKAVEVFGTLKRTRYAYNVPVLLSDIAAEYGG